MDGFPSTSSSNYTPESCIDNIRYINQDLHPYQTLSLLVPTDDRVWIERGTTWLILFKIIIGLLAVAYLAVGIISVILIVKKNCLRLSARTFFAVYFSMAILGFSRAAFFILDPFGILGYISSRFPAWIIISRFMASVGFPSLVGACSLIILTLVKLVQAKVGKQWYENWNYVLVMMVIPYAIALVAEALGHIETYPAIFSGLVCETFFTIWGMTMCMAYIFAGTRLLNKIRISHRRATFLSESKSQLPPSSQNEGQSNKMKRIYRKIIIITYGTSVVGVFYSLVSAGAVVMLLLLAFNDCMGFAARTNPTAWLSVQLANFITELLFAVFILYSITDVTQIVNFFKCLFCCYLCPRPPSDERKVEQGLHNKTTVMYSVHENDGDTLPGEIIEHQTEANGEVNRFKLQIKKPSESSIESVEAQRESTHKKMTMSRSYNDIPKKNPKPIDVDTVSMILSVSDDPPLAARPSKRNWKRYLSSDSTTAKHPHSRYNDLPSSPSGSDNSSTEPLKLRHCLSHNPTGDCHIVKEPLRKLSLLTPVSSPFATTNPLYPKATEKSPVATPHLS